MIASEPYLLQSTRSGQLYQLGRSLRLDTLLFHEARERSGRRCWVKRVPADDEAAIARLRYEAIILNKLRHVGIVRLLDRGRNSTSFFLVLEPAAGHSLLQLLDSGPLKLNLVFSIAAQLSELLMYLHDQGIICRTLPPASLYVDHLDRVTLVDLSAAWDEVSPPRSNELIPNAIYLSPEEAGGMIADRRSDIYVYGVLLFELLAGRPPFEGTHRGDLALQHLLTSPPDLRMLRPDIPPAFADLVARCLAKVPTERYSGAAALQAALHVLRDTFTDTSSEVMSFEL
jgi:serine/threonine protein kinase